MAKNTPAVEKSHLGSETVSPSGTPLIFISHDSRDAELAEAFSKLLRSVSAGMLKSFRSSDKKGTEGIEFGDEWFKRLMEKLQTASDVVCIFTERSLDRPWILYEAGVAKGRLETPVHGIALGIPLSRVGTGPFYQFQNLDDTEDSLTKLVLQLARRVPALEPDADVVKAQVKVFKASTEKILEKLAIPTKPKETPANVSAGAEPVAKLFEEVKVMFRDLPTRMAERVADGSEPHRRRRQQRFHPMILEEFAHMTGDPSNPLGILLVASLIRDDLPWLYEVCLDVYRAVKAEDLQACERELKNLNKIVGMSRPFFEPQNQEEHMMMMEIPRMVERALRRCVMEIQLSSQLTSSPSPDSSAPSRSSPPLRSPPPRRKENI